MFRRKVEFSSNKRFNQKNSGVNPITWVSAYPPARGRLSEYAGALLNEVVSLLNTNVPVLYDGSVIKLIPLLENKSAGRIYGPLSILALWIKIIKSRSRIVHFNLSLTVFGKSRIMNFLGLLSVVVSRLSIKKFVVTLHNIFEGVNLDAAGYRDSLMNRIGLTVITKIILSSAHIVVVPVKYYVRLLRRRYKAGNMVWIPHGAWFTETAPSWRWQGGRARILFLGYLSPYKDLKILSDVVKEIGGELWISGYPNPNFSEEGKKVLDDILREDHVKYLGYVENVQLPELVSKVSLVALPYITCAGTSGVVHLLSGLGTPFIAFATKELKELADDGAGILLVEMSKDALKDGIKKVMERRLAEELSGKSRVFALSRSWCKVAKMYIEIYKALIMDLSSNKSS